MNTKINIKNFRVFDENGVVFDIKPITILTGCNSAGKSTVVKAMLILRHFFTQIKNAIDTNAPVNLYSYKIDVASDDLKSLGNFMNTIHRGSISSEVTFEYTIYSLIVSNEITVRLTFEVDQNDDLKNGLLFKVSMSMDGIEFYSSNRKQKGYTCNLNVIKDKCPEFLELENLIHRLCSLNGEFNYSPNNSLSTEEFAKLWGDGTNKLKTYNELKVKDVLKYVYSSHNNNQDILMRYGIDPTIFDWTKENGSYFKIPIITDLDNVGKEKLRAFVQDNILIKETRNEVKFASEKIISDFLNSGIDSFIEYFKKYENSFFDSYHYSSVFNSSRIPHSRDFFVPQDYIKWNQYTWDPVSLSFTATEQSEEEKNKEREERKKKWEEKPVDFPILYDVIMEWNKYSSITNDDQDRYLKYDDELNLTGGYKHLTFTLLGEFLTNLVYEVLNPNIWTNISYASSSRVEANPYYSLSDGSRFASTLKRYFDARRKYQDKRIKGEMHFEVGSYINNWVQELGIGERIDFQVIDNLEIVSPRLYKKDDEKGCFLTDVGFGVTQLLSVLIPIETQIITRLLSANEGKGINRYAGIYDLFKLFDSWKENELKMRSFYNDTIAIEEPEIHLHPSYQSQLAKLFIEAYSSWGIHFIIETHSEYLIRKLQLLVAGKDDSVSINNDKVSIAYIYSLEESQKIGVPQVKEIPICKDGYLDDTFGSGFFDEATSLSRQLI